MKKPLLCAGGSDAPEPVTGRKGSFAAAAAFVLPPAEEPEAEVATSHIYQARQTLLTNPIVLVGHGACSCNALQAMSARPSLRGS